MTIEERVATNQSAIDKNTRIKVIVTLLAEMYEDDPRGAIEELIEIKQEQLEVMNEQQVDKIYNEWMEDEGEDEDN